MRCTNGQFKIRIPLQETLPVTEYRTTAEQLKHEKFIYLTGIGLYSHENRFSTLVEQIESLISKENSSWAQLSKRQGEQDQQKK